MAKHLLISFIWATKMNSRQISEIRHVVERSARFGNTKYEIRSGAAIILAIVLTTLLAMVGVLFLLSSRVDSVATSTVGDNEDLKLAVNTVVAQISEVITRDVPGVDPTGAYYDYPDDNNPWLASLEPNYSGVWPHVTDLYYPRLGPLAYYLVADVNYEHADHAADGIQADADGDGASDSRWVQVLGKMSAKGKPIYAAIRIIDNGGMLNVNTAYKFDPNSSVGSTQLDINLMTLSWRPSNLLFPYDSNAEHTLRLARNPSGLANYENDVIWRYGIPNGAYTPFDISDELEMRYRFVIDQRNTHTRLESWSKQFDSSGTSVLWIPFDDTTSPGTPPKRVPRDWRTYARYDDSNEPNYAYRHIATTYNCDRIINPNGQKMFNINTVSSIDKFAVRDRIAEAVLDQTVYDANQIAANLIDYIDTDSNVTVIENDPNLGTPKLYYGFETPCIYISEIAESNISFPNDVTVSSYAIELYKPYWTDPFPATDPCNGWRLLIDKGVTIQPIPIVWSGSHRLHVIEWIDNNAPIEVNFSDVNGPNDINEPNNPSAQHAYIAFSGGELMELQRYVSEANTFITVDYVWVPEPNASLGWLQPIDVNALSQKVYSYQRDMGLGTNPNKLIRGKPIAAGGGLWSGDFGFFLTSSIGAINPWVSFEPYTYQYLIQAHPANKKFTNIGEIGRLFRTSAYTITTADTEFTTRLNLADTNTNIQSIFKYLTVMDPNELRYGGHPYDETRIKGRININTAPWFVLAQLPWLSYHTPNYDLARAIVNYRDTHGSFKNIGKLMTDANSSNDNIGYYIGNGGTIPTTLLTPTDGGSDLFELRDAIFARISNLITVRSDVFTAYILVRIGPTGPQKRVIAILDRSGVTSTGGKVKIVAIQSVPDPR
jgi:hypothetical protein